MTWALGLLSALEALAAGAAIWYYRRLAQGAQVVGDARVRLAQNRVTALEAQLAARDAAQHQEDEDAAQKAAAGGTAGAIGFVRDALRGN